MDVTTKRCTACGETKPVTEFWPNVRGGWESHCKVCRAAARRTKAAKRTDADRAAYRACRRAYRARNRERERERTRAYNTRNRERKRERAAAEGKTAKGRARRVLRDAVYRGRIAKPSRCQECGEPTPPRRLHGHHHRGYDRPLDVVWLCSICHGRAHWKPIAAAA